MASKRRTRAPAPLRSWRIDFIADNGKHYFMYVVAPSERAARTNARTAPVRVRLREIVRVVPHMTSPTFGVPVRGTRPRAEPPEPPPEPPPALTAEEEFDLRFSRDGERRREDAQRDRGRGSHRDPEQRIQIEVERDRDGEVAWIGYRIVGRGDFNIRTASYNDLEHAYDVVINSLSASPRDRDAVAVLRRRGSALPIAIGKDDWVVLYD